MSPERLAFMAELLLRTGTERFGPPTPAVRESILLMRDAVHLKAVLERAAQVHSWEELFAPG